MKTVKLFPNIRDCDLVSYEPFGHGNESSITLKAPAKINLYLDIQGTDHRGYHMLNMVNKVISLADVITVKVIKDGLGRLDFDCNKPGLPTDSRNTCVKAAGLFREYMDTTDSFSISLHKNIPHEAGLAGGSADGACVLLALNHIYGEPCDEDSLQLLSLAIGTDVPFCRIKRTGLCTGDGRNVRFIKDNMDWNRYKLMLVKPNYGMSTIEAYKEFDVITGGTDPDAPGHEAMLDALAKGDMTMMAAASYNALMIPAVKKHPQILEIVNFLKANGACYSIMSGSGTTVYAYFDSNESHDLATVAYKAKEFFGQDVFTYWEE